jgi:exonuclease SbcD
MKLLYFTDPHYRGTNPRNRIDDYLAAATEKTREIFALAKEHQVQAILCGGDDLDRPEIADGVKNKLADLMNESPVDIYTTVGNHTIYGYNPDTYENTSLRIIERMCPKLEVVTNGTGRLLYDGTTTVYVTFEPYSSMMDVNGYGYSPRTSPPASEAYQIHVAHGMLLDHTPPFDRFTLLNDVVTTANMVLTGHDHTGFGVYRRADGVTFVNPGSITRIAASVSEIERTPQVAIITVLHRITDGVPGPGYDADVQLIPLKCAKPGGQVLDRSKIEADQKRAYAMAEFAALIQAPEGEKAAVNVTDIVETIATKEQYAPEVVKKALEKIAEQRAFI